MCRTQAASRFSKLLAEPQGQTGEPTHERPYGQIAPLDVRRAYRPYFVLAYAEYATTLGADHFGGRVIHGSISVVFYDRPELRVRSESQVDGFGIALKSIRADLGNVMVAAALVGVCIAVEWPWES